MNKVNEKLIRSACEALHKAYQARSILDGYPETTKMHSFSVSIQTISLEEKIQLDHLLKRFKKFSNKQIDEVMKDDLDYIEIKGFFYDIHDMILSMVDKYHSFGERSHAPVLHVCSKCHGIFVMNRGEVQYLKDKNLHARRRCDACIKKRPNF